jgi:hypothetical protein
VDTDTKEHDRLLRKFLIEAVGLYMLFKEYVLQTEEPGKT